MLSNREANSGCKDLSQEGLITNNKTSFPGRGYKAAWGVSLRFAGAVQQRTLIGLAFAAALALTALPLMFVLWRVASLTQELQEIRAQVDLLERQVHHQLLGENNGDVEWLQQKQEENEQLLPGELGGRSRLPGSDFKEASDSVRTATPPKRQPDKAADVAGKSNPEAFLFPTNQSLLLSKALSSRLRRSNGNKNQLLACPKARGKNNPAPVFIHLHGNNDQQYQTVTADSVKTPIAKESANTPGYITGWVEEEWCQVANNKKFAYYHDQGFVVVTKPGLYLLYVQLAFLRFNQVAAFQVFVKPVNNNKAKARLVTSCYSRSKEADFNQLVTCSTTAVVCLNNHDSIYVKSEGVIIDMQHDTSTFGLYRLYAAEDKKGKPFCPDRVK